MKKIALATVAALSLGITGSAYAIGATDGFFFAGQAGVALTDLDTGNFTATGGTTANGTSSEFSWGVDAGYNFMLAPNWLVGVDLGFAGLGDYKATLTNGSNINDTAKSTFYSTNFLGSVTYVYNGFHVWGETGVGIGITQISNSFTGEFPIPALNKTSNETQAVYIVGAGAGYQWEQLDFFVRYDHYFGDNKNEANHKFPKIDAIYGGVAYTF